jgi:hypothetical protein
MQRSAKELVALQPDVIVSSTTPPTTALLLMTLHLIGQLSRPFVRMGAVLSTTLLSLTVIEEQLRVGAIYLNALARDPTAYRPYFTPAIYRVARAVELLPEPVIFSVDWGIHMQLVGLAPPGHRNRYRDFWPFFKDLQITGSPKNTILDLVPADSSAAFVAKPMDSAVFPETTEHFERALSDVPACVVIDRRSEADISPFTAFTVVIVQNNCREQ